MFNRHLHNEIDHLKSKLNSYNQITDSLNAEMLSMKLCTSGKVLEANELIIQVLGYATEAEFLEQNFLELVPKNARNTEHYAAFMKAVDKSLHWAGAIQVLKKNGNEAWLRIILQPVENTKGKLKYFKIYGSDLTRTIKTSREHENLIAALMRSTAVIEFDMSGHVITANDIFLSGMGYSLEQIKGQHHRMFCEDEEANSPEYQQFWEQLGTGEYVANRFKRLDSKGQTVWLEASYNPITDLQGNLYKVVKFATVITDQVNREQAVAEAADIAYSTSQETDASLQKGSQVVKDTVDVMHQLADQMAQAASGIAELDEQSQLVGKIIQSIRGIADQTNLLALNAAIEAARAGEQGRGFAVVADEVRELASRTSAATQEIVSVVEKNQTLADKAVSLVEEGKVQAEKGLTLANEAGNVIVEVQEGAHKVVNSVEKFATQLNKD